VRKLYPELTRSQLEIQYHHMVAAVWLAAHEKHSGDDQSALNQVSRWLDEATDRAAKSAAVRAMRNAGLFAKGTETIQ